MVLHASMRWFCTEVLCSRSSSSELKKRGEAVTHEEDRGVGGGGGGGVRDGALPFVASGCRPVPKDDDSSCLSKSTNLFLPHMPGVPLSPVSLCHLVDEGVHLRLRWCHDRHQGQV